MFALIEDESASSCSNVEDRAAAAEKDSIGCDESLSSMLLSVTPAADSSPPDDRQCVAIF